MLVLLRYGTSRILRLLVPKEVSCAVKAKFLCCGTPAEAQRLDYSVSTRYGSVEQVLWRISRTPGAVVHRFSHSFITIVTFPPSLLFLFGAYAYEHHQAQVAHLKEVLQELRKGPNGSRRPLIWLAGDRLHVLESFVLPNDFVLSEPATGLPSPKLLPHGTGAAVERLLLLRRRRRLES